MTDTEVECFYEKDKVCNDECPFMSALAMGGFYEWCKRGAFLIRIDQSYGSH